MKSKQVEKPEQARILNGIQLIGLAKNFGSIGLAQCKCPCESRTVSADDSHFFASALAIIGSAAVEDRASGLYDLLTKWARENLSGFPPELRDSLYPIRAEEFPEIIHEEDEL